MLLGVWPFKICCCLATTPVVLLVLWREWIEPPPWVGNCDRTWEERRLLFWELCCYLKFYSIYKAWAFVIFPWPPLNLFPDWTLDRVSADFTPSLEGGADPSCEFFIFILAREFKLVLIWRVGYEPVYCYWCREIWWLNYWSKSYGLSKMLLDSCCCSLSCCSSWWLARAAN